MEKEVAQKIFKIRKSKGFSRENMANELGISTAAYRKVELHQTKLTVDRLFKISKLLDTPVWELLGLKARDIKAASKTIKKSSQKLEKLYRENLDNEERLIAQYEERISGFKERLREKDEMIALLKKGESEYS